MNTHSGKSQEKKSKAIANHSSSTSDPANISIQFKDNRSEAEGQKRLINLANNSSQVKQLQKMHAIANGTPPIQRQGNGKGLPDNLKSGIEQMSGYDMSNVNVNYNSAKPAQMQAHAYAQGNDIHLGPGQEQHLPHEAWHVVQQAQGRVPTTGQVGGQALNDSPGLENEADRMGKQAMQMKAISPTKKLKSSGTLDSPVQRKVNNIAPISFSVKPALPEVQDLKGKVEAYNLVDKVAEIKLPQLKKHDTDLGSIANNIDATKNVIDTKLDEDRTPLEVQLAQLKSQQSDTQKSFDTSNTALISAKDSQTSLKQENTSFEEQIASLEKDNGDAQIAQETTAANKKTIEELKAKISANSSSIDGLNIQGKETSHTQNTQAKNLKDAEVQAKETEIQKINDDKATVNTEKGSLETAVMAESTAVDDQLLIAGGKLTDNVSTKVDALTAKYQALAPDDWGTKFSLLFDMEFEISNWLNKFTTDGVTLKDQYQNEAGIPAARDKYLIARSKILGTRKRIAAEVFAAQGSGYTLAPDEETSTAEKVSSAGELAKDSLETVGSSIEGIVSAEGMVEGGGIVFDKDTGVTKADKVDVTGATMSKEDQEKLSIVGDGFSGAAGLAEGVAGIAKFIAEWKTFGEKDALEKGVSIMEAVESATNAASGAASLTKAIMSATGDAPKSVDQSKDASDETVKSFGDLSGGAKFITVTPIIASSVTALKNLIQSINSIYKATQRAGVDKEAAINYAVSGGISIASTVKSGFTIAKGVLDAIGAVAPLWVAASIPGLGLAINGANAIFSIYKAVMAGKQEKALKEEAKANDMTSVAGTGGDNTQTKDGLKQEVNKRGTAIPDDKFKLIIQEENRGVLAKFGAGQNYLRFNAYILAKIDQHIKVTGANSNLDIPLKAGSTLTLEPGQIKYIREYEYISKVQEINQKEKVRGTEDGILGVLNVAGDIAKLTGVAALAGQSIQVGTGGFKAGHSLLKKGQSYLRDRDRGKLESDVPGASKDIQDFATLQDYDSSLGKAFGSILGRKEGDVDKSEAQKGTEAGRHAIYIMERIGQLEMPTGANPEAQAQQNFNTSLKLLKATGVDMYDFLNAKGGIPGKYSLLKGAIKKGDMG